MNREFIKFKTIVKPVMFKTSDGNQFDKTAYISLIQASSIKWCEIVQFKNAIKNLAINKRAKASTDFSINKSGKVVKSLVYGYIDASDLYPKLIPGTVALNLDICDCFVANFSASDLRKFHQLEKHDFIEFDKFAAVNCIFHNSKETDLSYLKFADKVDMKNSFFSKKLNFNNSEFGRNDNSGFVNLDYTLIVGGFSFSSAKLQVAEFSLKNAIFKKGKKNFEKTDFGNTDIIFLNTDFGNGDFSFSNVQSNSGKVIFKMAQFGYGKKEFNHTQFGTGEVSFSNTRFGDGDVSFRSATFDNCKIDFTRSRFGQGEVLFLNTNFGTGTISFVDTDFNDGKVSFKEAIFNHSETDFHFSKFGNGDVVFDKALFGNGLVDFRAVDFNEGKVNFYRTEFGDGDIIMEGIKLRKGKLNFKHTVFGNGHLNLTAADCEFGEIIFDQIDFGDKSVSFYESKFASLVIKNCYLNNYFDMRVQKCQDIDLSDSIVRDIVDFTSYEFNTEFESINLSGVRLLGQIYIDWNLNSVKHHIYKQESTNRSKSEQFRMLKENYNSIGQYSQEDEAYVEFKRTELKANHEDKIKEATQNRETVTRSSKSSILQRIIASAKYIKTVVWAKSQYAFQWLVFDQIGLYATNPVRVLISMLFTYVIFSMIYLIVPFISDSDIIPSVLQPTDPRALGPLAKGFYHSAVTFLTIGYGDYYPHGLIRWLSGIEGFIGLFLMSYFTVAFVRKILR